MLQPLFLKPWSFSTKGLHASIVLLSLGLACIKPLRKVNLNEKKRCIGQTGRLCQFLNVNKFLQKWNKLNQAKVLSVQRRVSIPLFAISCPLLVGECASYVGIRTSSVFCKTKETEALVRRRCQLYHLPLLMWLRDLYFCFSSHVGKPVLFPESREMLIFLLVRRMKELSSFEL